jgi:hypothetical protein
MICFRAQYDMLLSSNAVSAVEAYGYGVQNMMPFALSAVSTQHELAQVL